MDKLPEWPDEDVIVYTHSDQTAYMESIIAYWEARARLAVEALDVISSHTNLDVNEMQDIAAEAYDAIGPLPAQPTEALK
jgi:hypothetical protein